MIIGVLMECNICNKKEDVSDFISFRKYDDDVLVQKTDVVIIV